MRIAVVGSGISGNVAARILSARHEVDLYESDSHAGGHAQTVDLDAYGHRVSADVAFMVLNGRTYPNFCRLLELLEVAVQDSDMSLSVRCRKTGLEYQGSSLGGLFAQRTNLFRPTFHRMLLDVVRFNHAAIEFCRTSDEVTLLGEFLDELHLGSAFRDQYLIPMSAAIWSADPACLEHFPAKFILGFFRNHGLLQLRDRPQWMTVAGRSRSYVDSLLQPLRDRIHLNAPVSAVRRTGDGVALEFTDRCTAHYDHAVMACHADQTMQLLDTDDREREILAGFPYQRNQAVLHTDASVLPQRRRAWASWNYHIPAKPTGRVSVTYDLNRLQSLGLPGPLCLTLNHDDCLDDRLDDRLVLGRFEFEHPVFSIDSVASQRRFNEINGRRGVSFCGAYWGYGFHEDGVNSALAVTRPFGLDLEAIAADNTTIHVPPRGDHEMVGV